MNVVVLGRPGAGKGTQSKHIATHHELRHLSTGELLRSATQQETPLGRRIAEQIDAGNFVSDELAMSLVREAMHPPLQGGYVLDGIPRTVGQCRLLSDLLMQLGTRLDAAVLLEVNGETVRRRLLQRAESEGRSDDTAETIGHRLAIYEVETAPVVDYYRRLGLLRTIDGTGTPVEVFQMVQEALNKMSAGEPNETRLDS